VLISHLRSSVFFPQLGRFVRNDSWQYDSLFHSLYGFHSAREFVHEFIVLVAPYWHVLMKRANEESPAVTLAALAARTTTHVAFTPVRRKLEGEGEKKKREGNFS